MILDAKATLGMGQRLLRGNPEQLKMVDMALDYWRTTRPAPWRDPRVLRYTDKLLTDDQIESGARRRSCRQVRRVQPEAAHRRQPARGRDMIQIPGRGAAPVAIPGPAGAKGAAITTTCLSRRFVRVHRRRSKCAFEAASEGFLIVVVREGRFSDCASPCSTV